MSAIKTNQVLNLDGDRIGSVVVDSIANMKNLNPEIEANATVELLGYYSKGDGGGGTFYWDSTSIEDDNGGTIIEATGVVDGRWIRNYSGAVNVKWFGIGAELMPSLGITINDVLSTFGEVEVDYGIYTLSEDMVLDGAKVDFNNAHITAADGKKVVVSVGSHISNFRLVFTDNSLGLYFGGENYGNSNVTTVDNFHIESLDYGLDVTGVTFDTTGCRITGVVMSRGMIKKCKIGINAYGTASGTAGEYVTNNNFTSILIDHFKEAGLKSTCDFSGNNFNGFNLQPIKGLDPIVSWRGVYLYEGGSNKFMGFHTWDWSNATDEAIKLGEDTSKNVFVGHVESYQTEDLGSNNVFMSGTQFVPMPQKNATPPSSSTSYSFESVDDILAYRHGNLYGPTYTPAMTYPEREEIFKPQKNTFYEIAEGTTQEIEIDIGVSGGTKDIFMLGCSFGREKGTSDTYYSASTVKIEMTTDEATPTVTTLYDTTTNTKGFIFIPTGLNYKRVDKIKFTFHNVVGEGTIRLERLFAYSGTEQGSSYLAPDGSIGMTGDLTMNHVDSGVIVRDAVTNAYFKIGVSSGSITVTAV